jgi:iron(III) transport system substrate-binding protein
LKTCADVDKAFQEGALVHYSPDTESEMVNYLAAFRKAFPQIQTTYLRLQTGALYARLSAERQAKAYLPDTLVLTEMGFAIDFQKRGGYASHGSPESAAFKPYQQSSPPGFFTWSDTIVAGIAYNPTLVRAEDAPKSYTDLLNPLWADAINTKLSTSGLQHLAWYTLRRLHGPDFWKRFAELHPRGFDSSVQQFDRMVSGQDKVIATAQYSNYLLAREKGAPIVFVVPTEGLIVTPSVLGVVDHAPHPEAARLFVDWFLGVPEQTTMTRTTHHHSARTDVPPPPNGEPVGNFTQLVPDDWDAFMKTHAQFVKEWNAMMGMG